MTPSAGDPRVGQTIGRFRIRELLGRGGMGAVYRAWDLNLRRHVALKLLPPNALDRLAEDHQLRREALALSRLTHPHVVAIHELVSTPESDCIVMEFVAGDSLDRILRRGALTESETLRLGVQLARGLTAAHEAGVIHRDMKPDNLRLARDGSLKILDFGLAKRIQQSTSTVQDETPESQQLAGTPAYIAPEVWCGQPAGKAADLYAVGVILYEMATGVRPFHELGAGIAHATIHLDPPPPRQRKPGISAELETVVMRCLEKNPARRFSSAKELADALETLLARRTPPTTALRGALQRVPASRRHMLVASALALTVVAAASVIPPGPRPVPAPPMRSLVVLPFTNLSEDSKQEYFSVGMTEELIAILGEDSSLRVISRTSVYRLDPSLTLPEIARELQVEGAVQGAVRVSGDRVRLTVQLYDAPADRQLWSERYQGDLRDVHDIQSSMARSIAREIGLRIAKQNRAARRGMRSADPVAYQLYLHGRYEWNRRSPEGVRRSIDLFSRAIARDSLLAVAHCGLADAWSLAAAGHMGLAPPLEAFPRAKEAVLRALALDPKLSEAYVSLANIRQNFDWDWAGAAAGFRRAIELNASNSVAHHWYANHLAFQAEFDRALDEFRHAQDLDQLSFPIRVGAGACLYYARRYDEALKACREASELESTSGLPYRAMAGCYYQLGRRAEAAEAVRRWLENDYSRELAAHASDAYRRGGLRAMARMLIEGLKQRREASYEPATHLAELSILGGDREAAIRWLQVAYDERDTELNRLKVDPIFDPLRGDPRYQDLLRRVGLGPARSEPGHPGPVRSP